MPASADASHFSFWPDTGQFGAKPSHLRLKLASVAPDRSMWRRRLSAIFELGRDRRELEGAPRWLNSGQRWPMSITNSVETDSAARKRCSNVGQGELARDRQQPSRIFGSLRRSRQVPRG